MRYDHRADAGAGLLNGQFANETAAAFAERLRKDGKDVDEQVRARIRLTTGRVAKERKA